MIVQDEVADIPADIQWQGPSVTSDAEGTYAADMLSAVLDDPASTFQQRLLDNGLFASCVISYLTRSHVGPITLVAHTSVENLTAALSVLQGHCTISMHLRRSPTRS